MADPRRLGLLAPDALDGKRALVTGAAGGIGAQVALELASSGADVVLLDSASAAVTAARIEASGGQAQQILVDVADREAVTQAVRALPAIDIVVTAAGIYGAQCSLEELSQSEMDRVLSVNLCGTVWTVRAALPQLRKSSSGRVVCLGSMAAQVGGVLAGPQYVASKGAIHAFVKWLARTEASSNILVNGIAPGAIETPMIAGQDFDEASMPLGRIGTPDEVARLAAFLSSPLMGNITGAILDINGGTSMGS